jgi:hypothetical protein
MGEKIKPEAKPEKQEKEVKATPKTEKVKKTPAAPKEAKVEEKNFTVEARQMVHSRQNQVGQPVLFVVAEGPARGAVVMGKIVELQKMEKDQPGRLKISLESGGNVEVLREKGKDELGGKDVFMMVGYKQAVAMPKKVSMKAPPTASKAKKGKGGPISAQAAVEEGKVTVKMGTLKYPTKLDVYFEPPASMKLADINEESLRLVRVNDVPLPQPVAPSPDKIKVADHDKDNVQELDYKFDGWTVIQYLPGGTSSLLFSASTKDGKPIEATARVTTEYQ